MLFPSCTQTLTRVFTFNSIQSDLYKTFHNVHCSKAATQEKIRKTERRVYIHQGVYQSWRDWRILLNGRLRFCGWVWTTLTGRTGHCTLHTSTTLIWYRDLSSARLYRRNNEYSLFFMSHWMFLNRALTLWVSSLRASNWMFGTSVDSERFDRTRGVTLTTQMFITVCHNIVFEDIFYPIWIGFLKCHLFTYNR